MKREILTACNFISKLLSHSSISLNQSKLFRSSLHDLLEKKFITHWDPSNPLKGNAYRSILLTENYIDPVILISAKNAGIGIIDKKKLPSELILWIDPNEVTYRFGDNGPITYLNLNEVEILPDEKLASIEKSTIAKQNTTDTQESTENVQEEIQDLNKSKGDHIKISDLRKDNKKERSEGKKSTTTKTPTISATVSLVDHSSSNINLSSSSSSLTLSTMVFVDASEKSKSKSKSEMPRIAVH